MTNRDWISEANKYLRCKYSGLDGKFNQTLSEIEPGLHELEAKYFVLGIEQGLFIVDCEGYAQTSFLPPPKKDKQKITQLSSVSRNTHSAGPGMHRYVKLIFPEFLVTKLRIICSIRVLAGSVHSNERRVNEPET